MKHLSCLPFVITAFLLQLVGGESVGEKILRKIATGFRKSVMEVKTCGQPRIKNVMRNLTLNPGDTARFHCSVDMKCMVSYIQWHHEMNNGTVRLLRTGATQGTPYRYTVRGVNSDDEGFYLCLAGNILGETVSSAYLQVNKSPQLALIAPSVIAFILLCFLLVSGDLSDFSHHRIL